MRAPHQDRLVCLFSRGFDYSGQQQIQSACCRPDHSYCPVCLGPTSLTIAELNAMTRPNILFVIADDASHFGCYGHTFVNTPNIDRVARQGIRFNHAFTTNPKCAPSRASILTGRHTWQNLESSQHWNHWPDGLEVFTDRMEESGYRIGYTGKAWGPGDWKRCGRTRNPVGPDFNQHQLTPPTETGIRPNDYTKNFEHFLQDADDPQQPFFFWFGAHEPHRAYVFGEGERHGKSQEQIAKVPPYWPDSPEVRTDMLDYAYQIEWLDQHLGRMLDVLEQRGELDHTLVMVTSDNGCPFPRVKGQMYDDDFRLPFVAMCPSLIAPGRVVDDLISFVDIAPTCLEAAGLDGMPGGVGRSMFELFASQQSGRITNARDRAYMGRERHDMGREGDLGYPVRCLRTPEYLYCRNFEPERWPAGNPETGFTNCDSSPTKTQILDLHSTGQDPSYWELAFGKRPLEELYDIRADPHCMRNLAEEAEMQTIKQCLWSELQQELVQTGDPRLTGNPSYFDSIEDCSKAPHSWAHFEKGTFKPQQH